MSLGSAGREYGGRLEELDSWALLMKSTDYGIQYVHSPPVPSRPPAGRLETILGWECFMET